ncbi:hypothetical protein K1Y78_20560 [Streptomyces sp. tea 10]|nr:hypothetical protein [Streptomyces sp. tea 10]
MTAGALIAREAGALVTDAEGRPWHIGAPSFLAASPHLHPAFVQLLGKARSRSTGLGG